MERKVGEVFNDGKNKIQVVISKNGTCAGCHYWGTPCEDRDKCCKGLRSDNNPVIFKKIGESKMDNKEELKRSLAEEEQRAKDSLANVEKIKKQLEELNKKEEQPTVSATGVYLDNTMEYLYSLDYDNSILYQLSTNSNIDARITKLNLNNAFATREQAEQEALRREGQEFIRRCAMLWNKDHDWRKIKNIIQYCIRFNGYKLEIDYFSNNQYGQPFFDTRELAERCITELKAKYNEEQIKTIFGVK